MRLLLVILFTAGIALASYRVYLIAWLGSTDGTIPNGHPLTGE